MVRPWGQAVMSRVLPAAGPLVDHFPGDAHGDLRRGHGLDRRSHRGVDSAELFLGDTGLPEPGIDGGDFGPGADDADVGQLLPQNLLLNFQIVKMAGGHHHHIILRGQGQVCRRCSENRRTPPALRRGRRRGQPERGGRHTPPDGTPHCAAEEPAPGRCVPRRKSPPAPQWGGGEKSRFLSGRSAWRGGLYRCCPKGPCPRRPATPGRSRPSAGSASRAGRR